MAEEVLNCPYSMSFSGTAKICLGAPPPPGFSEEFVFVIHMLYICDIIYNEKDYEYGSS